jgi:hypothetical protein
MSSLAMIYCVLAYGVEGVSNQPLLDACPTILAMGADPCREIALFCGASTDWDLKTNVGYGAGKRVVEEDRGGSARDWPGFPPQQCARRSGQSGESDVADIE